MFHKWYYGAEHSEKVVSNKILLDTSFNFFLLFEMISEIYADNLVRVSLVVQLQVTQN